MEKYSELHIPIKTQLVRLAERAESIDALSKSLKRMHIHHELLRMTREKEILVFTGSSDCEVYGCSVRMKNGSLEIEDMRR